MKPTDIVEEFLYAIEEGNFTRAEGFASDNFRSNGIAPEPLEIREFLGIFRALIKGMPDFRFNYEIMKEKTGIVDLKIQIIGKHTNDMPSPVPGLKDIPATDTAVKMPVERIQVIVRDQRIEKFDFEHTVNGGLPGLLNQLGAEMPAEVHHER